MFDEIYSFLSVIYILLLIFLIINIILLVFYPEFSFRDYFNKGNHKKSTEHDEIESDAEEIEIPEELEDVKGISSEQVSDNGKERHYVKYNQEFKIKRIASGVESKLKGDKITYNELIELLQDDEFLEGYLDSVRNSLSTKLKTYRLELNKIRRELSNHTKNVIPGGKDTYIDNLVLYDKAITDIIEIIKAKIPKLSIGKLKKNFKSMIYNKEKGFISLVGREDIKDFISRQIYTFYKNPNIFLNDSQGLQLLGNSGVGKTRVARTLAYIYSKSYILARELIVEKTPKDFTSHYVNEDKRITYKILLSALEGVLFEDEAYGMVGTGISLEKGHGEGIMTEIVAFDTDHSGRIVMILAGYENEMNILMQTNQGLSRRFPHRFVLKDYTSEQLTDILIKNIKKNDPEIEIDDKDANCIYTCIDTLYKEDKSIFSKQGSDMIKLASHILSSIYMSKNYLWEKGKENFVKRTYLLTCGFNSYLESKGLMMTI